MQNRLLHSFFWVLLLLGFVAAQTASSTAAATQSEVTVSASASAGGSAGSSAASQATSATGGSSGGSAGTTSTTSTSTNPPDVYLRVPELAVDRIELDVDNLQAEINLAAQVAGLVEVNAGIQISVQKVNITIANVEAELELVIRLGNLVDIVNRTLATLDLNPLLINVLNEVTDLVDTVVGAVDGLLGSIVNGDSKINFIIDNLGNIVQEVVGTAGSLLNTIIGNYQQNMTYTGQQTILDGGLIQKTYSYAPLGSLVNIIFNAVGQVVQAVVVKGGSDTGTTTSSTLSVPTITASATATG